MGVPVAAVEATEESQGNGNGNGNGRTPRPALPRNLTYEDVERLAHVKEMFPAYDVTSKAAPKWTDVYGPPSKRYDALKAKLEERNKSFMKRKKKGIDTTASIDINEETEFETFAPLKKFRRPKLPPCIDTFDHESDSSKERKQPFSMAEPNYLRAQQGVKVLPSDVLQMERAADDHPRLELVDWEENIDFGSDDNDDDDAESQNEKSDAVPPGSQRTHASLRGMSAPESLSSSFSSSFSSSSFPKTGSKERGSGATRSMSSPSTLSSTDRRQLLSIARTMAPSESCEALKGYHGSKILDIECQRKTLAKVASQVSELRESNSDNTATAFADLPARIGTTANVQLSSQSATTSSTATPATLNRSISRSVSSTADTTTGKARHGSASSTTPARPLNLNGHTARALNVNGHTARPKRRGPAGAPSSAVFAVDVTEKICEPPSEPLPIPKHFSGLPNLSRQVKREDWEKMILWDGADEVHNDDEDDEDEENPNKARKLVLDINDPFLIYDEAVRRPEKKVLYVLTQNKGRHRIPDYKLEEIANAMAEKDVRFILDDRFNLSNDRFYTAKHENKFHWLQLERDKPSSHFKYATSLDQQFFPTHLTKWDLRNFHRPVLQFAAEKQTFTLINSEKTPPKKQSHKTELRKRSDVTATSGDIILAEYAEEHPLLMMRPGMGSVIRNFYRCKSDNDPHTSNLKHGIHIQLKDDDSPFMGLFAPGQSLQALENNLFRSPLYHHTVKPTDFVVIRTRESPPRMFIRRVKDLFVVGQQMPKVTVPVPNSQRANTIQKERLEALIQLMFRGRRGDYRSHVKLEAIKEAMPTQAEPNIRKVLQRFAEYKRGGDDIGSWRWNSKITVSDQKLFTMMPPEKVCAYEAMLAAERRYIDMGITAFSQANEAQQDTDEAVSGKRIPNEVLVAPWYLTENFNDCVHRRCLLAIAGPGDPTGSGGKEGFSYIRIANKPMQKRKAADGKKKSDDDVDLRKIPLKLARELLVKRYNYKMEDLIGKTRWHVVGLVRGCQTREAKKAGNSELNYARSNATAVKRHKNRFAHNCQVAFDGQNRALSNTEEPETDDEDSDDEEERASAKVAKNKAENDSSDDDDDSDSDDSDSDSELEGDSDSDDNDDDDDDDDELAALRKEMLKPGSSSKPDASKGSSSSIAGIGTGAGNDDDDDDDDDDDALSTLLGNIRSRGKHTKAAEVVPEKPKRRLVIERKTRLANGKTTVVEETVQDERVIAAYLQWKREVQEEKERHEQRYGVNNAFGAPRQGSNNQAADDTGSTVAASATSPAKRKKTAKRGPDERGDAEDLDDTKSVVSTASKLSHASKRSKRTVVRRPKKPQTSDRSRRKVAQKGGEEGGDEDNDDDDDDDDKRSSISRSSKYSKASRVSKTSRATSQRGTADAISTTTSIKRTGSGLTLKLKMATPIPTPPITKLSIKPPTPANELITRAVDLITAEGDAEGRNADDSFDRTDSDAMSTISLKGETKRRRKDAIRQLNMLFGEVCNAALSHADFKVYGEPMDSSIKQFKKKVPEPLTLKDILSKCSEQRYRRDSQLYDDVDLLMRNYSNLYGSSHFLARAAERLVKYFSDELSKHQAAIDGHQTVIEHTRKRKGAGPTSATPSMLSTPLDSPARTPLTFTFSTPAPAPAPTPPLAASTSDDQAQQQQQQEAHKQMSVSPVTPSTSVLTSSPPGTGSATRPLVPSSLSKTSSASLDGSFIGSEAVNPLIDTPSSSTPSMQVPPTPTIPKLALKLGKDGRVHTASSSTAAMTSLLDDSIRSVGVGDGSGAGDGLEDDEEEDPFANPLDDLLSS